MKLQLRLNRVGRDSPLILAVDEMQNAKTSLVMNRLANHISSPASQEHFNWLCKAICTRVWSRKIVHKFKPTTTPHGIHLLTKSNVEFAYDGAPILAICMAWHMCEVPAITDQLEVVIQNATRFDEPFDSLVIFVSPEVSADDLTDMGIVSHHREKPRRMTISIVSWDDVVAILAQNRSLLKSYVQAGLKAKSGWFLSLPDELVKKPRTPRRMPSSRKLDRDAVRIRNELGDFSYDHTSSFDRLVCRTYTTDITLVSVCNSHDMGYSVGVVQKIAVRPYVLIDLWLLTAVSKDVERLSPSGGSMPSPLDAIHYETLSWIRFACQEKIKRELVLAFHTNNRNRSRDRLTGALLADACELCVRTVFYDPRGSLPLESSFSKARAQPAMMLSWQDLFPDEYQDDCHIISDVLTSESHLIVIQWKFVGGLEIENEYKISLCQVSTRLADHVKRGGSFDSAIPHSHTVRLESEEVYTRSDTKPREKDGVNDRPTRLQNYSCQSCNSTFFDLSFRPASYICALCERLIIHS